MFEAERLRVNRKRVCSRRGHVAQSSGGSCRRGCCGRESCGRIDRDGLPRRTEDVGVWLEVRKRWRVDMCRSDRTLCGLLRPMQGRFRIVYEA